METQEARKELFFEGTDARVLVRHIQRHGLREFPSAYHQEMELQFIYHGAGSYFIDGHNYPFNRNSVIIIHPNEVHSHILQDSLFFDKYSIIFSVGLIENDAVSKMLLKSITDCHHIVLGEKEAVIAQLLLEDMSRDISKKPVYWHESILTNMNKLLIFLARANELQELPPSRPNSLAEAVIAYVEDMYQQKLSLSEVAAHFCISPNYLSREIKECTGMSFKQYLTHRRIIEAERLLRNTDSKVLYIAQQIGFDDLSCFNRSFKMIIGVSPSQYRRISEKDNLLYEDSA